MPLIKTLPKPVITPTVCVGVLEGGGGGSTLGCGDEVSEDPPHEESKNNITKSELCLTINPPSID